MPKNYIAITDANKNFSKVAKICNEFGEVIILKNNKMMYSLKAIDENHNEMEITDDEKIDIASRRILKRFHKAFEELAKWLN